MGVMMQDRGRAGSLPGYNLFNMICSVPGISVPSRSKAVSRSSLVQCKFRVIEIWLFAVTNNGHRTLVGSKWTILPWL